MKTNTHPPVVTPIIIVLVFLAVFVVVFGVSGKKVPVLSNTRVDIILLVVLGMAICQQGGIGRVAVTGEWSHPLAILGYFLGGLIVLISISAFADWKLPLIQNEQQALLVIGGLMAVKITNSVIHYMLNRM